MADWMFSKSSFMNDPYFQFSAELNGDRRQFRAHDMEVAWEIKQFMDWTRAPFVALPRSPTLRHT